MNEAITTQTNPNKKFKYLGENMDFFVIWIKNMFLTAITFGIYYPWAKVEILKYHYQNTQLEDRRFQFTGTGKEVFKGFIKVYIFFIVLYGLINLAALTENTTLLSIVTLILYVTILIFIPLAIHGAIRYRSSRTTYSGIHFKYFGNRKEFFKLFFKEFFLTMLTFGIYGSWMQVHIREYIYNHLKFGNITFDFKGEGADYFLINLKGIFLSYITLGIYTFWYQKEVLEFWQNNTKVYQNDKETKLQFNISVGDVFTWIIPNIFIILFTLGFGTPIAEVRTMKFMLDNLSLNGPLDLDNVSQGDVDDYGDAAGDDFLDFLDFDFI